MDVITATLNFMIQNKDTRSPTMTNTCNCVRKTQTAADNELSEIGFIYTQGNELTGNRYE